MVTMVANPVFNLSAEQFDQYVHNLITEKLETAGVLTSSMTTGEKDQIITSVKQAANDFARQIVEELLENGGSGTGPPGNELITY